MTTASILAVPGLAETSDVFKRELAAMADRNGWNVDGPAMVIAHESRFAPDAVNPSASHATGLIQFIEPTARALGTTTAQIKQMSDVEQLRLVEAFFQRYMRRPPSRLEDWILIPYGRTDAVGASDSLVLDRQGGEGAEARRYSENSALDGGGKGTITVGDLRRSASYVLFAAHGERVAVPPPPEGPVLLTMAAGATVIAMAVAAKLWWLT